MGDFFQQIGEYLQEYGFKLLFILCIIVVGIVLCWLVCFLVKKILLKTKIDGAITSFVTSLIKIAFAIIIVLVSASVLELSTSGLIVSLSTLALAIGLALKDSFGNIANGILIIANKPFRRGDLVSINGVEGKVHNIKLLTVELITPGNVKIVMPNNTVLNGNVINYSALPIRRLDMTFGVAYGSDMDLVEKTLKEVCESHEKVLKNMKVTVFMENHDDSSIVYQVRVWVNNGDYFTTKFDLPRMVYDAFEKNNITIPFPQLDVHFDKAKE